MLKRLFYPVTVFVFMWATWVAMQKTEPAWWDLIPGLLSFPTMGLLIWLERRYPERTEWQENQGDGLSDWLHTLLLFPVVLKVSQITASFAVGRAFGFGGVHFFFNEWPIWGQFLVGLVLGELFFYCIHRAAHVVPFLWAFHRVHHGALRVYFTNAGRFHPIDLWLTMAIYFLPLYFIAFPPEVMVLFLAANVVTGLLEHANVRFEAGWLNYFFNTAQLHRWHHSEILEEANQNYGKVLCVWDLVFGTHSAKANHHLKIVGIVPDQGVVPPTIRAQWGEPFRTLRGRTV